MGWFCCCREKDRKDEKEKGKDRIDSIIDCPRCHGPMVKKSSMGVTIDKCERCDGIWLDGGEIENIISRIEGQKELKDHDNKDNSSKSSKKGTDKARRARTTDRKR